MSQTFGSWSISLKLNYIKLQCRHVFNCLQPTRNARNFVVSKGVYIEFVAFDDWAFARLCRCSFVSAVFPANWVLGSCGSTTI